MASTIGPEGNLLAAEPHACRQIKIEYPILHNDQVAKLRHLPPGSPFRSTTLPARCTTRTTMVPGLERAMAELCRKASQAVAAGYGILILSDRGVDATHAPIPSLLATAGVHHHLVREGTRTKCGLLVETGDAREVHHVALLMGYGAGAVNPYLAFETLHDLILQGLLPEHDASPGRDALREGAQQGHSQGDVEDGDLDAAKLLRRADLRSGRSRSRVRRHVLHLDAVTHRRRGVRAPFPRKCASVTRAPLARVRPPSDTHVSAGVAARGQPVARSSKAAASTNGAATANCTCSTQRPCFAFNTRRRTGQYNVFKDYTRLVDDQSEKRATLRGLFRFKPVGPPIALERGRIGRIDSAALLHRRDVVRLDQSGSARDTGDRDEPDGRQVQYR